MTPRSIAFIRVWGLLGAFCALLCALPLPTFGQGAYVPARSVNSNVSGQLRPVAGATITVCAANTAGIPCAPPLAGVLFKDQALTQPLANPTTTDANGNYPTMALAAGNYTITETATGFVGFSYQITITCGLGSCAVVNLSVTGSVTPPFLISGASSVNAPTFNVAQTGAINGAGTLNGITEGCVLPANAVWNIMLNLNQCDAGGASIPSLPLYVQANPSGSQSGNTAGANWSIFDQMKCQNFTGNPAFLNCQGLESEAFYTGTLAVPNNLTQKALGGQVWIDDSTTGTTAQVPRAMSIWAGAPFLSYASCSSCGTGNFVRAIGLSAEQPTALDSKGNPVGSSSRVAAEFISNFTNDPVEVDFVKTGTPTWALIATANPTAQPFDFTLQNIGAVGSGGFRFQNATNGNVYIRSTGNGSVIINGNPTFGGEGVTTNGSGGLTLCPGGSSATPCNPATTSNVLNFPNNQVIWVRNAANSGDVQWATAADASNNSNIYTHGSGTQFRIVDGATTPLFAFQDDGSHTGHFIISSLLFSTVAPTIAAAGCGGSAASIVVANGTAAFKVNVGTTPTSACTLTFPAATTGWNVHCDDITTQSTSIFVQKQTGAESTTSVTITNFSDVAVATAFVASDILKCTAAAD